MSRLVARILLAMLMIPAAFVIYFIAWLIAERALGFQTRPLPNIIAGAVTWAFVAIYWFLLWGSQVQWNGARIIFTLTALAVSLGAGLIIALLLEGLDRSVGNFIGSVVAPLAWLIAATLIWRETPTERATRLTSVHKTGIVCPSCGYNLTGLNSTRCPECGTQYTLDELLASQPSRSEIEVAD